jgi:hypothetical protein
MASRRFRRLVAEQQQSLDDYPDVIVTIGTNWRVIRHISGQPFILQHRAVSPYYVGKWRTADTANTAYDMIDLCMDITQDMDKLKRISAA